MEETHLLTINEAADSLSIHPKSVYQAIREDRLPFVHRYGKKLVLRADVEAYRQRTQPEGIKSRGRPKKNKEPEQLALFAAPPERRRAGRPRLAKEKDRD